MDLVALTHSVDTWLTVESALARQKALLINQLPIANNVYTRIYLHIAISNLNKVIKSIERATTCR